MTPKLNMNYRTRIVITTVLAAFVFAGCDATTSKLDPKNLHQVAQLPTKAVTAAASPSSSPAETVTPNPALAGAWTCSDTLSDKGVCSANDIVIISDDLKTMTHEMSNIPLKASPKDANSTACDIVVGWALNYTAMDSQGVMTVSMTPGKLGIQEDANANLAACQTIATTLNQNPLPPVNLSFSISDYKTSNDELRIDMNDGNSKQPVRKIYVRQDEPSPQPSSSSNN